MWTGNALIQKMVIFNIATHTIAANINKKNVWFYYKSNLEACTWQTTLGMIGHNLRAELCFASNNHPFKPNWAWKNISEKKAFGNGKNKQNKQKKL